MIQLLSPRRTKTTLRWRTAAAIATQGMAYSPSLRRVISVGNGTVYYSDDGGRNWTEVTSSVISAGNWVDVSWSPILELFVAVSAAGKAMRSSDGGATWSVTGTLAGNFKAIAASTDTALLVAVGSGVWMHSADAITWSSASGSAPTATTVKYSPTLGLFFTNWSGVGLVYHTATGASWTAAAIPIGSINALGVSSSGTRIMGASLTGEVAYTDDGDTWTEATPTSLLQWVAVAHSESAAEGCTWRTAKSLRASEGACDSF